MDMKLFSYSLIQYVADVARAEAINLGVIVVSDGDRDGRCLLVPGFQRKVRSLYPQANVETLGRLLTGLCSRVGSVHQGSLFVWDDDRITSAAQLTTLSEALRNQIQLTQPHPFRATSIDAAAQSLLSSLVDRLHKERPAAEGMTQQELNDLVKDTIARWTGPGATIEEPGEEAIRAGGLFADFWLRQGQDLVAVIAIPEDPGERQEALLRRAAVPTLVRELLGQGRRYRVLVVLPPERLQRDEQGEFIRETARLLRAMSGVLVRRVDDLAAFPHAAEGDDRDTGLLWPASIGATAGGDHEDRASLTRSPTPI